jgi:ferredoxin
LSGVTVRPAGWRFEVLSGETVLDAARRAGIALPRSCRNGTCRACLCPMLEGRVRYRIEWPGLSAQEKAEGLILPCVALIDEDVVIDVPSARRVEPPRPGDTAGTVPART